MKNQGEGKGRIVVDEYPWSPKPMIVNSYSRKPLLSPFMTSISNIIESCH